MSAGTMLLAGELLAAGALYLVGAGRVPRWPSWRTASFAAALVVLFATLSTDPPELTLHMVQHLVLCLVAAPLLVLGSPLALALRARRSRRGLRAAWAAHPFAGWAALAIVMALGHLPEVLDAAEAHPVAHVVLHVAWIAGGVLFWRPVLGADPVPHRPQAIGRLLYLILFSAPMAATGMALQWSGAPWYAGHSLHDQRMSGVVMLIGGGAAFAVWMFAVAWSSVLREHRRRVAFEERTA